MMTNPLIAAADPMQHVLPHRIFDLPFFENVNFEVVDGMIFLKGPVSFTSHMLMLLISSVIMLILFPLLARDYPLVPRGVRNFFEAIMEFIRNEVAKPSLKEHTDRFMPFLWTMFFFILINNLLGLVPLDPLALLLTGRGHVLGTATAGLSITAGLAVCSFFMFHFAGSAQVYRDLVAGTFGHHHHPEGEHHESAHHQPAHASSSMAAPLAIIAAPFLYLWNFAPHVFKPEADVTGIKRLLLWLADVPTWFFLLGLEFIGALVKPFALAMRLFANMMAGHVVLASLLVLIPVLRRVGDWGVAIPTLLGCTALGILELFVAFLQAYIFTFLTAMFLGAAVSPEH